MLYTHSDAAEAFEPTPLAFFWLIYDNVRTSRFSKVYGGQNHRRGFAKPSKKYRS